jgi:hypothetical protein
VSQIFGVTGTSLLNFHHVVSERYKRSRVVMLRDIRRQPHFLRRLRRARLIITTSVNELNIHAELLSKYHAPIVVFDNPANLHEHKQIVPLDIPLDQEPLNFKFVVEPINYSILFDAIQQRKRDAIVRHKPDLLAKIISSHTVSGFLNLFNTFLYSATVANNRSPIRDAMVLYVFNHITEAELRTQMLRHIKLNPRSEDALQKMLEYINSTKGTTLRAALEHAKQLEQQAASTHASNRRTVRYKELVHQHGVDRFELRNLMLLYRALPPSTLYPKPARRKSKR